ncbi:acyl-CoA-like ligand-binding transcription factor [Streptomyces sp. DW26H14]|uniref:acyl-CoA-like ligand-binding transcription factor n=1 Tax=Streptomyces sp. DW26H14 TaxID=3435395 RepID=UPI00403DA634
MSLGYLRPPRCWCPKGCPPIATSPFSTSGTTWRTTSGKWHPTCSRSWVTDGPRRRVSATSSSSRPGCRGSNGAATILETQLVRFVLLIRSTPSLRAYRRDTDDRQVAVAAEALARRNGMSPDDPEPQVAAAALLALWPVQFRALRKQLNLVRTPRNCTTWSAPTSGAPPDSSTPDSTRSLPVRSARETARPGVLVSGIAALPARRTSLICTRSPHGFDRSSRSEAGTGTGVGE